MAGNNILEALSFNIEVFTDDNEAEHLIGIAFQKVEDVLAKPGWSALKRVSFKVACWWQDLYTM